MFMCQITNKQSEPYQKLVKVVVESRPRTYTEKRINEETDQEETVVVGRGWEIVREVNATEDGAKIYESWSSNDKAAFLESLKG